MGKSYTVLRHLESLDVPYQLFNSRMTAKGLFLALQWAPDAIHVMEDMERLTKDPDAQGVLRSALWAQPGHDRVITWTTATDGKQRFVFRGGLILISNRPLADLPELRAMATRIEVHRLEVSDAELAALMRELAGKGISPGRQGRHRAGGMPPGHGAPAERVPRGRMPARPPLAAESLPELPPVRGGLLRLPLAGPGRRQRAGSDLPLPA